MKALPIDFSPTPWWARQPPGRWIAVAVLTLSLLGGIAGSVATHYRTQALQAEQAEQAALAARRSPLFERDDGLRLDKAQRQALHRAITALNTPWRDLFEVMERSSRQEVALLALEASASQQLLVTAEAKTTDAMLAYVQSLQRQPGVEGVDLMRHKASELDPAHPIRFTLAVTWQHGSPPEGRIR